MPAQSPGALFPFLAFDFYQCCGDTFCYIFPVFGNTVSSGIFLGESLGKQPAF
jgi:hypothetical protein